MKTGVTSLRRQWNTELIEIRIPGGTTKTKFQFPDQQNLRDTKLMGLQVYTQEMIPISIVSDSEVAILPFLKRVFVTLQAYNGENFVWQKPAINLIDIEAGAAFQNYAPPVYTKQKVNFPKSYIELASGIVIPGTDTVVLFEVNYLDKPERERAMRGAEFKKQS